MASTTTQVRAIGRVRWLAGVASFAAQDGGFSAAINTIAPGHCVLQLVAGNYGAESATRVAIAGSAAQNPADSVTFSAHLDAVTGAIECAILEVEAGPSVYTDRDFWIEVTTYISSSLP